MPRAPKDPRAKLLAQERFEVLGRINNPLAPRYDPGWLAQWWRQPCEALDGHVPETVVSGEFDPADPLVQRLVSLAKEMADKADAIAEEARRIEAEQAAANRVQRHS